nr:polyprotein [Kilifi Virus]
MLKTIRVLSPCLAIVTNVSVLVQMDHGFIKTPLVVTMLGVHLVAIIDAILQAFGVANIAYSFISHHVKTAIEQIVMPVIRKPMEWIRPNTSEIIITVMGWLRPILSILFLTVGFFFPKINMDEWCRSVNTKIAAVNNIQNATNELTNKVLEDVCGVDLYGSKLLISNRQQIAEEGIELCKTSTEIFIRDLTKRQQLFSYTKRATETLSENIPKESADLTRTLSPFNTIIHANIKTLSEIIKTIEECTQLTSRPPAIGVLLSGLPGVGKSKFSEYAMVQIASNLGLDKEVYSVSKSGDYFDPYKGQHFGIHDEFLYARSEDPIIPILTKLLSGEYFNMEGAAIHNKKQTCELKMVTLTTNGQDPSKKLVQKIDANAVKAIWDRIVRVNVLDKLTTSRHDATGNTHRKPDFTHLTLKLTISTEDKPDEMEYVQITPSEYIMYFTYRIANNITSFCRDNKVDIYPLEQMQKYMTENQSIFEGLSKRLISAIGIPVEDCGEKIPSLTFVRRNMEGRNFFVIRLEGKAGTGKSTTAENLAVKFSRIFNMQIENVQAHFPIPGPKPTIYIVDDILTTVNSDQYIEWINRTNQRSIFIICTNLILEQSRTWMMHKYTDVSSHSESSGIARRIGVMGNYKHKKTWGYVDSRYSTTVTMQGSMYIDANHHDPQTLMQLMYTKYIAFVSNSRELIVINDNHGIQDPDLHIHARNFKTFSDTMKSKTKLLKSVLSMNSDFSIKPKDMTILKEFSQLESPDVFIVQDMTNKAEFEENVKSIVSKLCIYRPETTVVIDIEEENITAGYKDRCLYLMKDLCDVSKIIKHSNNTIFIPKNGGIHELEITDLAWFKTQAEAKRGCIGLSATEMIMIDTYISRIPILQRTLDLHTHSYAIERDILKHKTKALKSNLNLEKCLVFILGLSGVILAGVGIYDLYDRTKTRRNLINMIEEARHNTLEDENHAIQRKIMQRYQKEFAAGRSHEVVRKGLIEEFGKEAWQEAEWTMRSNNSKPSLTVQEMIETGEWIALRNHWRNYPDDMPIMSRNQITSEMIEFQQSNQIETLSKLLEINTVLLINTKTGGRNFALGLYGSYLVSVAHAVADDMEACTIINNGMQYPVICVYLSRKRDIAFYAVKNNAFSFRDIRGHFADADLFGKTNEGYYLRTISDNRTIAACTIRYTAKRLNPITDDSPYFNPDEGLYTVMFATSQRPIFLKSGDCGFPLVVRTNQGLKVIAIHNAVTPTSMAFFASVSQQDFGLIPLPQTKQLKIESNTHIYHFNNPGIKFISHEWYEKILTAELREPKLPRNGLNVIGYCKEAHLPSFPKDSHRELLPKLIRNELQEKLPTKPSALKFNPKVMKPDKLVKDKFGEPHTLWTQSVKYSHKEPLYNQFDPVVYKISLDIIKQRITRDYGAPMVMNLKENINGNNTNNNKGWDVTTSAGPLLKKLYAVHTKEPLFENKGQIGEKPYYIFNKTPAALHTREMYEKYCEALESGTPIAIWCKDNRKVELLPSDKVTEGKVRLFNEIDFSVNLVLKKYFGHMLSKILDNHVEGPYKIGMDVYSEATFYNKMMNQVDGNLLSTDISGCDKTMPKEIIRDFCEAFCQGYDPKLVEALAQSLIYTIHIMDGIIYTVDGGNESGSFITTMLNCFAMEMITVYPVVEELMMKKLTPTLNLVCESMNAIYYGDDRSVRFSKELSIQDSDLVRCGSYFNFKVTPAKVQSEYISFCSREFIPDEDGIVFPKLKQTSVLSCLFWVKKPETQYISANINVALFEAAMHEEAFFRRVVNIVLAILKRYPEVTNYVNIYDYNQYRTVFKQFIYGLESSPVLLKTDKTEKPINIEIIQNLEPLSIQANTYNNIMDFVSALNTKSQKESKEPKYSYTMTGPKEAPTWECTATYNEKTTVAQARTKKAAQQQAAKNHVQPNNDITKLTLNMQINEDMLRNKAYFEPYSSVGLATIDNSLLSVNLEPTTNMNDLAFQLGEDGYEIVAQDTIRIFLGGEPINKIQILIDNLHTTPNNDTPIEPATINQAAMGSQRQNLPSQSNPQPTAVNPAMTNSGEDIVGAVTTALPETLNPIGAPDMLAVGAITFDIKDLIYQQFIDCDNQLTVSDDAVEGTIIAQIPYGLHSDYVNSYIKYYAKAHERFNGSIQFRFTVIGNPLFSGAIGIAWYPKKITTPTMKVSELMKYSYQAEGVTSPWNKIHILHDARRRHFYRLVEDEESDYVTRPHLVMFLMMSIQNPLKEGVQCRIRIASKLANSREPNPFTFANPDITINMTSLMAALPGLTTPLGTDAINQFPSLLNQDWNIFTDGSIAAPQVFKAIGANRDLHLDGPLKGPYVRFIHSTQKFIGDSLQFSDTQKYPVSSVAPSDTNKAHPSLVFYTNVPIEQFKLFYVSLKKFTGALTSATHPDISTTAIPDSFYTTLQETVRDLNKTYKNTSFIVIGMSTYRPDSTGRNRFGCVKVITTHGVIMIDIVLQETDYTVQITSASVDTTGGISRSIYGDIDTMLTGEFLPTGLPAGYRILRVTPQAASAVIRTSLMVPTATDSPVFAKYYRRLAENLTALQCVQFSLIDSISQGTVATVRYLQEYGIFVINTNNAEQYSYLPQTLEKLSISAPAIILRANAFPYTNTNNWISRVSATYFQYKTLNICETEEDLMEKISLGLEDIPVRRNASLGLMMAGGMLSGIGSAMGQKSKYKHELNIQGNQLTHEKEMQASDQQYGFQYQKNNFRAQAILSGQNFLQTQKIAQQQQEYTQQNAERSFNQQILLAGARTPVSGVTTASSKA